MMPDASCLTLDECQALAQRTNVIEVEHMVREVLVVVPVVCLETVTPLLQAIDGSERTRGQGGSANICCGSTQEKFLHPDSECHDNSLLTTLRPHSQVNLSQP
jgi:hypothetical protein